MKKNIYWMIAAILTSGTIMMSTSCGGNNEKKAQAEAEATVDTVAVEVKRDTFPADKWMEENKQKEGVVEKDGIQYRILKEGTGKIPELQIIGQKKGNRQRNQIKHHEINVLDPGVLTLDLQLSITVLSSEETRLNR